jgi:hypothetical protein
MATQYRDSHALIEWHLGEPPPVEAEPKEECAVEWKTLLKYLFLFSLMVLIGCAGSDSRQQEAAHSGKQEAASSSAPMAKFDLDWKRLGFANNPARLKVEQCHLLNELDFLVLYFGLSDKPFDAAEFEEFVPEYKNSADEFLRRDVASAVVQRLDAIKSELLSAVLCARIDDLLIGEYDFRKKGFPLLVRNWGSAKPGLQTYAFFMDGSKSALATLGVINVLASSQGRAYEYLKGTVDFDNMRNAQMFPPFISLEENIAQQVRPEFGHFEDPQSKEISEALGAEYKGFSTIVAYVIFSPKAAAKGAGMAEGYQYDRKEVHGEAHEVVFATPRGTVLAVYPIKPVSNAGL